MDDFADIKNEIINNLNKFENTLWKSLTQATKDKDTKKVDGINSAIKRKEYLESEILKMFDQLGLLGKPAHDNFQTSTYVPTGGRAKAPKPIPKSIRIGEYVENIRYLNEIPIVIANWILDHGQSLPEIPNFVHSNIQGFAQSANIKQLKNGWFIEVGDDKQTLIIKGRKLLDQTGFISVNFDVEMHNGEVLNG